MNRMSERSGRSADENSDMMDRVEEIITRNENRVFRAALAITGNKADAEDIIQDVFIKLIEKIKRTKNDIPLVASLEGGK